MGEALGLPRAYWGSIATDPRGTLWVRSAVHLFGLARGGARFEEFDRGLPPTSSPLGLLLAPPEGGLMSATDEGLAILEDGGARRWEVVNLKRGLPADTVAGMLRDREGSLWVALRGVGLARWLGFRRVGNLDAGRRVIEQRSVEHPPERAGGPVGGVQPGDQHQAGGGAEGGARSRRRTAWREKKCGHSRRAQTAKCGPGRRRGGCRDLTPGGG